MKLMTTLFLFFSLTPLFAQELDLYFPNNETEMMQYERPRQLLVGLAASARAVGNLQVGYSPINHLSLDVGYMFQINNSATGSADQDIERTKRALTFSLGTYWVIDKQGTKKRRSSDLEGEGQLNARIILSAKAGYSLNDMNSEIEKPNTIIPSGIPELVTADLNYHSAFASASFGYDYEFGLLNISATYRTLYYQKVSFGGRSFDDLNKLTDVTAQLREDSTYDIFSIGVHNQFGKGAIRVLVGGTFPVIYFQEFRNQAAEVDGRYLYLGVLFDVNDVIKKF